MNNPNSTTAQIVNLRNEALACWHKQGSASEACGAAWDGAIAAMARGNMTAAREYLETALAIADAEGGGWEEREAIRLLTESAVKAA